MKAIKIVQSFYPEVTRVVDAKEFRFIAVLKEDSIHGVPKDHCACALARACKRSWRNVESAVILPSTAYLIRGNTATRYRLPARVYREIVSFDRGGGFEPGRYWLAPFVPSHRLGQKKKKSSGSSGKKYRPFLRRVTRATGVRELSFA